MTISLALCSIVRLKQKKASLLFEINHPLRLPLNNTALALGLDFRILVPLLVLIPCMMWFFLTRARTVVWASEHLEIKTVSTGDFSQHLSIQCKYFWKLAYDLIKVPSQHQSANCIDTSLTKLIVWSYFLKVKNANKRIC